MKKKLVSVVQLAIGVGLIAFILLDMRRKGDLGKLAEALGAAADNWPLLALGALCFFVCLFLCTVRWQILLAAQGLPVSVGRALSLTFVGQFFNSFLLGVTGGDVVKAYFVAREAPHKKTAAVATVFIDRIVGLLALIVLTVSIMFARLPFFLKYPRMRLALVFNLALFVGSALGLFAVFRHNLFERWQVFRKLEQKTVVADIIGKAYSAFHICIRDTGVLVKTLALSAANHVIYILCAVTIGRALEINISLVDYFTVIPVVNAVAAIPLTPGGLGTREATAIYVFDVLGVPEAKALSLSFLMYATVLAWSVVGGIIYLAYVLRQGIDRSVIGQEEPAPGRR